MGRSARWQGPDAPGAGADPWAGQARMLRVPLAGLSAGGEPSPLELAVALGRVIGRLIASGRAERSRPWLVRLRDPTRTARSATWLVAGPAAAAVAATAADAAVVAVVVAVRAGRVPEPPGARLVDVRDPRSRTADR